MKKITKSPYVHMKEELKCLLEKQNLWNDCCEEDIPKRWEKHGDLILFPSSCFSNDVWNNCHNLWETIVQVLNCTKIARKYSVKSDDFRSPHVQLLFGTDGWTTCQENGIRYSYDVTKCMFSAGNITEKLRIAKFDCREETVVDMYAGIGYFTLPYLVHAKAEKVHACEWNPDAIEALEKNLILNKVRSKCIIHYGNNKKMCPVGIADRVNLGLLPTSESGWKTACLALKSDKGGILHIHGNVTSGICTNDLTGENTSTKKFRKVGLNSKNFRSEWTEWGNETAGKIKSLLFEIYNVSWTVTVIHVEHVKSYAPHVDHLVADIQCAP